MVKSGDTLEAIAARHGTSVERLLELNPEIDPVALTIGQRIRVG
jgi:LysM repeat protein